jgi:hypothetical protein
MFRAFAVNVITISKIYFRSKAETPTISHNVHRSETGCRLSILLRIDAEFLHSRKESRPVHSQACGSTIRTTDAPLACGERPYDLITLPPFIFVSNAAVVALRVCCFSSDLLDVMLLGIRGRYRICFPEFSNRCLKRFAARDDHRPLDKILQLANVAWPVPSRKPFHDGRRNSFNLLLHLLGKLLHKITHQLWNVFLTFPQGRYPDRKYMQAIVQITSEFAGCNHLFEIAIGRRDEPNIGSSRVSAPQSFKLAVL